MTPSPRPAAPLERTGGLLPFLPRSQEEHNPREGIGRHGQGPKL